MAASPEPSITAPAGSTDFTPELQMANMLGLCEAQMESALHDSDQAVDALIKAFSSLVETTRAIDAMAQALPPDLKATLSADFDQQVGEVSKQMSNAVMAFQFYDKLTQRLGHVRYSLSTLAMFVCDRTQSTQPEQWKRLLNTLRRLYRTEEERQIFQTIIDGVPSDKAQAIPPRQAPVPGAVELF